LEEERFFLPDNKQQPYLPDRQWSDFGLIVRMESPASASASYRPIATAPSASIPTATALVSAVAEISVSLVAAVSAAAAVPVIDTGDTRDDAPSSSEAVRAAAVGAFRIDGQ